MVFAVDVMSVCGNCVPVWLCDYVTMWLCAVCPTVLWCWLEWRHWTVSSQHYLAWLSVLRTQRDQPAHCSISHHHTGPPALVLARSAGSPWSPWSRSQSWWWWWWWLVAGDNGRGQDWVGRLCWTETVIGGQCWDNTPIVEDNGGCVPLELDGRGRGGLASLSYALGPLLYLMYCVVPEPQRSEALLGLRGTQYYKDNILSFHCW